MIFGYVCVGLVGEMFSMLVKMYREGLKLMIYVFGSVLKVCCIDLKEENGMVIYCYVVKVGMECDIVVGIVLFDMYVKYGSLKEVVKFFGLMFVKNVVMYNVMIFGFFYKDDIICGEVLKFFMDM